MRRPGLLDLSFAALIVIVGFAPLLVVPGWAGSGTKGDFTCSCGQYNVLYSDPGYGGDRPHVFALYLGEQIDLIQFSDAHSTVDGLDLYSNFTMSRHLSGGSLVVDYSSPSLNFTKLVSVEGGVVHVDYRFGRTVNASLTFWRWYYASIGPFDRPVTRSMAVNGSIPFSVFGRGVVLDGVLSASPAPRSAFVAGVPGEGLNKLTLTFMGDSVDLAVALTGSSTPAGVGAVEVASTNGALPMIAVAMAATYLGARSWMEGKK